MANGYYERGEVYWLRLDGGVGSEMGIGRPAVVVSSPENNNRSECVVVAYTTKQYHNTPYHITTYATGIRTYVVCSQLYTYDKSRLQKLAGVLSKEELRLVDDALEKLFDLGYIDNSKDEEIEAKDAEIADLKAQIEAQKLKYDDELLSYKVENTMWQRCYDKVLTQLVDMKCTNDLFVRNHLGRKTEVPVVVEVPKVIDPEEPVLPVEQPKEPEPVKDDRVDINHCTQTQLKKVGMSDALARAVVAKRPFNSVADLKNVPGMNGKKFQIFEPKLTCTPLEIIEIPAEPVVPEEPVAEVAEVVETVVAETEGTEGKLNINILSGVELIEKLGMSSAAAYAITGYRRKHGPYAKVEDLANIPRITMHMVERYRDKIYCGPDTVEEPTEQYTGPKVNINTASAKEIHDVTGLDMTVCYSITGCRKRDGLYRSVEDVRNIPRFKDYHWLKYGKMFEV